MKKIRTLLIEDSGLMRIMISDALRSDPGIEVIGTANNGKDGVSKVNRLKPDVVISDMMMPHYDGLYAVENIMKYNPVPIILLSSLGRTNPGIFKALNNGAFDFIDKPETKNSKDFKLALNSLIEKVKIANGTNSHALGKTINKINHQTHSFAGELQYDILVIGASTGGPSTVESILDQLPVNLPIPVVIAQHMPPRFLESFARRLDGILPFKVKVARTNENLSPGTIYLLPGDGNMMIDQKNHNQPEFRYTNKRYKEFDRPSVDCLFDSVADIYGPKAIGIILTGMGKDGSQGLLKIKRNGGLTISQDAKSCAVYGMPKASVDIGAVDYVVKLADIPGFVMSCF